MSESKVREVGATHRVDRSRALPAADEFVRLDTSVKGGVSVSISPYRKTPFSKDSDTFVGHDSFVPRSAHQRYRAFKVETGDRSDVRI